ASPQPPANTAQRTQAGVAPPAASAGSPSFAAGRYAVRSLLGQGGVGVGYPGQGPPVGAEVALETILPQFVRDEQAAARFAREARALARLNHPNVLAVYDYGREGDTHYLVMELGGPDLGQLLEFAAGPLPLAQAVEIGAGIARALEYAHAQGI